MICKIEKAFNFSSDLVKQLISLSTGTIVLVITFSTQVTSCAHWFMIFALIFNGISVACGVWTLMALTGTLEKHENPSIYENNIRIPSTCQLVLFLLGLVMLILSVSFNTEA